MQDLRVSARVSMSYYRVCARVAGQERDLAFEPVFAQPIIRVEPARLVRAEVDVEQSHRALERAIALGDQLVVAARADRRLVRHEADRIVQGLEQVRIVVEHEHLVIGRHLVNVGAPGPAGRNDRGLVGVETRLGELYTPPP